MASNEIVRHLSSFPFEDIRHQNEGICKIQHVKVNKDKLTVVTVVLVDLIVV